MKHCNVKRVLRLGAVMSAVLLASPARADGFGAADAARVPSGQFVTPLAVRGAVQQFLNPGLPAYPHFVAGEAVRSQLSPDGKTLAIITAGQNSLYRPDGTVDTANSTQYIFLYDVSGANKTRPALKQVLQQTNAFVGLAFSHDGSKLYVTGGSDDAVYVYARQGGAWALSGTIALGHNGKGVGIRVQPNAAGLALSSDGKTLVVANNYNDSISVIDTATNSVRYEHDLRPFFSGNEGRNGEAGGTFPFAVVVKGNGVAYVSSDRDREIVAIDIASPSHGRLIKRIKLDGSALGMTLDASQSMLFVAQDNADQVAVIETNSNAVVTRIDARAPAGVLAHGQAHTGAATYSVTLSRDGRTLYATNAGANEIAVIPLVGPRAYRVTGLIPTAFEPHDVTFSADGTWMYVVNGKSATGPNPDHLFGATPAQAAATRASNEYQFQLERASLVSAPVPAANELPKLTQQAARNNFYRPEENAQDNEVMGFLRRHIKHVIYVVKENRTFDQVLGDIGNGANGDPRLAQFGRSITPNFHRLASQFVTLDNFMNPGDGSMDGWSWALQGRVTNTETITQQINYAAINRGLSYESEGTNRNVPVNWDTVQQRDAAAGPAGTTNYSNAAAGLPGGAANLLPGTGNHASSDAPFGRQRGYIFDAVLAAGGTVRNYGFLVNNIGSIGTAANPITDPRAAGVVQVAALDPRLASMTDVYFRGYDQTYPDQWRLNEWKHEFDQYVAGGNLPTLSLVRLSHDHMGAFGTAFAGVNTPETQQADNDLAVGRLVEAVAKSPYANDTLIVVTEDDVQDGPDHVDSHRGPAYIIGPYVKQGAVIKTRYSQVNALRTIEDVLGTQHMNLNTAYQRPMTDVFDVHGPASWGYTAVASTVLKTTGLQLAQGTDASVQYAAGSDVTPKHDAAYWAKVTAKFNFDDADEVPADQFNRVLWKGMMGSKPYPKLKGRTQKVASRDDD
ncbi:beta-propeller fold lactonase family protein [Burkholderia ubonensis]|uniref:beta-propeller fold lactonase family protein n=1 Tax=Burkholderia ubonensis TaxID=101571 RepID=UPI0038F7E270